MQLYLFVDYDRAVFKLGALSKDAISENAVSSGTCVSNETISADDKALIALGIVVFLLICSLLFLYLWWRKESQVLKRQLRTGVSSRPSSSLSSTRIGPPTPQQIGPIHQSIPTLTPDT